MGAVLSDSSINMQWPAYWHVRLFEESIAILFNDCAKHWYINCYFQAALRSFAAPCIRSEQTSFGQFCQCRELRLLFQGQCFLFDDQLKAVHWFRLFLSGLRLRLLEVTISSNQVGRTDLTPIALSEFVFLILSLRRL